MILVPIAARFWSKVKIIFSGDACWEWQARLNEDGYGIFGVSHFVGLEKRGKYELAHRMAYRLLHCTSIAAAQRVLHTCDNPKCVRPQHLWLGTQRENVEDAAKKGRMRAPRGMYCSLAKLTDANVYAIKKRLAAGEGQSAIARGYEVSPATINEIYSGRTWRHIIAELPFPPAKLGRPGPWTPEKEAYICEYAGKLPTKEMARVLNVGCNALRNKATYMGISVRVVSKVMDRGRLQCGEELVRDA